MADIFERYSQEQLREKILAWSIPEPNSGCWIWLGALVNGGYACRTKCCVNPKHVEPLTAAEHAIEEMTDFDRLGSLSRAKTHCPSGHSYAEENLVFDERGGRRCRTCRREQGVRFRSNITDAQREQHKLLRASWCQRNREHIREYERMRRRQGFRK